MKQETYDMGMAFYRGHIATAVEKITPTTPVYDRIVLQELIEEWQLRMEQLTRRLKLLGGESKHES
jgi:hypothetical protein